MPAHSIALNIPPPGAGDPPTPNHPFSSPVAYSPTVLNFGTESEATPERHVTSALKHPTWLQTTRAPAPSLKLAIPKAPAFTRSQSLSTHWRPPTSSEDTPFGESESAASATRGQVVFGGESDFSAGYFSTPISPDTTPKRAQSSKALPGSPPSASVFRNRMVKERRSLQTLLIPSFLQSLHASPPSASRPSHSRDHDQPVAGPSNLEGRGSGEANVSPPHPPRERRISLMGRRRSQTYTGSLSRMDVLPPALPLMTNEEGEESGANGRISPPSGLLDADPFAPSPTAIGSFAFPPPTRHVFRTPPSSPPLSRSASTASLRSSVASDASLSMPGTPTLLSPSHTFSTLGPVLEESPLNAESLSSLSSSDTVVPVPAPPPPTPASPLNPNASANSNASFPFGLNGLSYPAVASSSSHQLLSPLFSRSSSSLQPAPIIPTRARPAHTRPAFAARPSLPSLTALARMHMSGFAFPLRGRKRRGRVGAGLPAEPWDLPDVEFDAVEDADEETEEKEDQLDESEAYTSTTEAATATEKNERRELRRERSKTMGEVSSTPFPHQASREAEVSKEGSEMENFSISNPSPDLQPSQEVHSEVQPSAIETLLDEKRLEAEGECSLADLDSDADAVQSQEVDVGLEIHEGTEGALADEARLSNDSENAFGFDDHGDDGEKVGGDVARHEDGGADGESDADRSPTDAPPKGDEVDAFPESPVNNDDTSSGKVDPGIEVEASTTIPGSLKRCSWRESALESTELTPESEQTLAIPIPRRASASLIPDSSSFGAVTAIPKHVLRELGTASPARNSLHLSASPVPSRATLTPSPLGLVDLGLQLGDSPRFSKHEVRRPDSLAVDPVFHVEEEGRAERTLSDTYRPDHLNPATPSESFTYLDRRASSSPRHVSDDSSVSDIGPFDLEEWPLPVAAVGQEEVADRAQDIGEGLGTGATLGNVSIPTRTFSRPSSPPDFPTSFFPSYSQDHELGAQTSSAQASHPSSSPASSTASSPIINRERDDGLGYPSPQATQYRSSVDSTYDNASSALHFDPSGSNGLYSRSGTRDPSPHSFDDTSDDDLTTLTYVQSRFFDEGEDSSMLPPLSTLPEDDPVFTLTPSGSRERKRYGSEYGDEQAFGDCVPPPPPSRALSRQTSLSTSNSASASPNLSLKSSISSSLATQLSHSHSHSRSLSHHKSLSKSSSIVNLESNPASRTHSPSASLSFSPSPSTCKSFTNTDSLGRGSGMFSMSHQTNGRRTHGYGSSSGSTDLSVASGVQGSISSSSGSGHAASNSMTSLRSHASLTFEKSARGRRQSSLAQLSLSSLRTKLVSPSISSPSFRESSGSGYGMLGAGVGEERTKDDRLVEDRGQRTYLKYSPAFAAVRRGKESDAGIGAENARDGSAGEREGMGGLECEGSGRYAELLEAFEDKVPATESAEANAKEAPTPSTIDKADAPSHMHMNNSPHTRTPAFEPGSSTGTPRPLVTKRSQTDMHRSLKTPSARPIPSDAPPTAPPSASTFPQSLNGITNRARSSSDADARVKGMPATTLARAHTEASNSRSGRGGNGHEWNGRSVGDYRGSGSNSGGNGRGRDGESSGSEYGHGFPGGQGSGGGGRDFGRGRDDGSRERDRKYRAPSPDATSSEEESESDSETDDYGQSSSGMNGKLSTTLQATCAPPAPLSIPTSRAPERSLSTSRPSSPSPVFNQLRNGRKGIFRPPTSGTDTEQPLARTPSTGKSSGEDDVPLARSIPGALQAQKSIRQQIRSLRDRRKKEKEPIPPVPGSTRTSRNPEGSSSAQYATATATATAQLERGRSSRIRPPISAPIAMTSATGPMSSSQEAAMMAQKPLQPSQVLRVPAPPSSVGVAIPRRPRAQTLSGAKVGIEPDDLAKRLMRVQAHDAETQPMPQRKGHSSRPSADNTSATLASRRDAHSSQIPSVAPEAPAPARTLRPMRSFHATTNPPVAAPIGPPPPPPGTNALGRRATVSRTRPSQDSERARMSGDDSHAVLAHRSAAEGLPPVPPVPALSRPNSPPPRNVVPERHLVQLRVYLNDMQRFNVVEARLDTNAKEVMALVAQRGEERPSSSWMLYEVCNDFGMERPMRLFELVTDVSGSWNKEKTSNCFMIKRSPFASGLSTIPTSIPNRSGYVDYEAKKGKWSKRWLELREHGLWMSKREGKDDEFLCSLSVFDAYIVTRIHKSSKSFTFAVKSTDPITLFENKSDYLHVFSVPEDTGVAWVESIWRARSYILHQERNVLRNKSAGDASGAGLGRAGTRKKPAQTFVTLSPTHGAGASAQALPFEPGSLLGNRV